MSAAPDRQLGAIAVEPDIQPALQPTGEALRAPVCVALAHYPARIDGARIQIQIGEA